MLLATLQRSVVLCVLLNVLSMPVLATDANPAPTRLCRIIWVDCPGCGHVGPILTVDATPPTGVTISAVGEGGWDGTCAPDAHMVCKKFTQCEFFLQFHVSNGSSTATITASGQINSRWAPGEASTAGPQYWFIDCAGPDKTVSLSQTLPTILPSFKVWTSTCKKCD